MIKVLLIESDPKTRDIIEVGLDNFQVFEVDNSMNNYYLLSLAGLNPLVDWKLIYYRTHFLKLWA